MPPIENSKPPIFRLLIVDDHQLVRETLQNVLSNFNDSVSFITDSVANGTDALERVKKQDYDLILMDYQMPEMNGDKVTVELLKIRPDLKVLGLSLNDDE